MKLGMITIDTPGSNLGNKLIEYSLYTLLGIPKPTVSVSMFRRPTPSEIAALNTCDRVLVPGSTVLAKAAGNSDALASLSEIQVPVFCASGSSWGPRYPVYERALRMLTPPIGCRDPHIYRTCTRLGIPAILVGCPTAYMPHLSEKANQKVIVGFSRKNFDKQERTFKQLRSTCKASVQEIKHELPFVRRLGIKHFTYEDPDLVYKQYARAQAVTTGRLHGLLPALSQNKPVHFFGNPKDSRFTLLRYLQIPVNPVGSTNMTFITSDVYTPQLRKLKRNFYTWASEVGLLLKEATK